MTSCFLLTVCLLVLTASLAFCDELVSPDVVPVSLDGEPVSSDNELLCPDSMPVAPDDASVPFDYELDSDGVPVART